MKSNVFIYIASNFLLLFLLSLQSELMDQIINAVCALGILTLGIAHGAIDNILYGAKPGKSNSGFIFRYVLIIAMIAIIWLLLPNLAFLLFLVVSAYHFGQSQFTEYQFKPKMLSKVLFLSWGSTIILLLLHFNGQESLTLQETYFNFPPILNHLIEHSTIYLISSASIYMTTLLVISYLNKLSVHSFFKEAYILLLIMVSIFLFPAFIAFSLFFVWLHSCKTIMQEFEYCKEHLQIKTLKKFIRLFLPLTIASILGTVLIVFVAFKFGQTHLIPYILLILISCVTIPHSFVMDKFYSLPFTKD
ncbi:MAG: Brp/Blh family beta-carotene 15,15'-monooxygenase [Flavobacteriales bacterium]|jgi:Brp/Blh family beta-carotene 15,15'-monooxygenase